MTIFKPKTVAAIEVTQNQWKLAVASPDPTNNQVVLEHIGIYSNTNKLKQDLSRYNISKAIYCITNQYSSAFATHLLHYNNLETEKNSRGIADQNCDYFSFNNASILVTLPSDNINEIKSFHPTLGLKSTYLITQTDVLLGYSLVRNYLNQSQLTTAIAHFTQSHIGLTVFQNGSVKQIVWHDITEGQPIDIATKLVEMLKSCATFCDQPTNHPDAIKIVATYDVLFIAGECHLDLAIETKALAATAEMKINEVELIDPLRSPLIYINNLPANQKREIDQQPHRYATVVAALAMSMEGLGLDLTLAHQFEKTIPTDAQINLQGDRIAKLMAIATTYSKNITPALINQKPILVIAVVLSIILSLYRTYSVNSEIVSLENDYSKEAAKEVALSVEKTKYEDLQKRNKGKNDRIASIRNIQRTQMLVPTILGDIQGLLFQAQFRDLVTVSKLNISGSEVKLAGSSIDKINATAFVSKLQNRSYEDVIPTRYTALDSIRCTYELTTRYNGQIPTNPIVLPPQSQVQIQQVAQTQVEQTRQTQTQTEQVK